MAGCVCAEEGKENAFLAKIKAKAAALKKHIVLCEGEDSRVVKAAAMAVKEGVAKITLLGNAEEIKKVEDDADPEEEDLFNV